MDVIAVVVTYNRLDLLKGNIQCLLSQSVKLKKIIIVDNASTDGTKDYLKTLHSDVFFVIFSQQNEGGAGGFYRGIKKASEIGCDAVWIMDDDTYPTQSALEKLTDDYRYLLEKDCNVGFVTSNVLFKDDKPCLMNISNTVHVWNEFIDRGLVRVSHSSFVSMLIPYNVIADVGLPIKEFFIWGDDGEYSTRIAAKYQGFISGNSTVHHMMKENVGVNIFNTPKDRINRFYFFYRNWMFTNTIRGRTAKRIFLRDTYILIYKICASNTPYKSLKIRTILKGLHDGKKFDAHIDYVHEKTDDAAKLNCSGRIIQRLRKMAQSILNKWSFNRFSHCVFLFNKYKRIPSDQRNDLRFLVEGVVKSKIIWGSNRSQSFYNLMKAVDIKPICHGHFVTSIDCYKNWRITYRQMDNATIDYDLIVNNGLKELKLEDSNGFTSENNCIIDSIILYIGRLKSKIKKSNYDNKTQIMQNLDSMISSKACSLEDAFQRIIIVNQLLWQTGHTLNGLGRIDKYLETIIEKDNRSDSELLTIIEDFFNSLHEYYWYKSSVLMGDTGQIMILGGLEEDGSYYENRLTRLFIHGLMKCNLPDPKILLRVSSKMPDDLLKLALQAISTGLGSPLLSNDDVIVNDLISFGYEKEDSYNYVTSACWEPIPANSFEQNNLTHINFVEPFSLIATKEIIGDIKSFEDYLEKYKKHLTGHSYYMFKLMDGITWEFDPLVSAFLKQCRLNEKDVSVGGCKYNNYGALTNGLSNAVNSLLTLKKMVFDDHTITLRDFTNQLLNNYPDKTILRMAQNNSDYFGHDEEEIISLTNELLEAVSQSAEGYRNKLGGTVKIGTSSPSYISIGKITGASYDGRLDGEAFGVHISGKGSIAYTELLNFAGKLDYNHNRFNGNVVDLMMTPNIIKNGSDSVLTLVMESIKKGVFQMQFNVVNSEQLRDAVRFPEKYPNLIVRVWGFSAYFVELPIDYQKLLIKRAEEYESSCF